MAGSKLIQIPQAWKDAVCAILRTQDKRRILIRDRAQNEWNAATSFAFKHELYAALEDTLTQAVVMGRARTMDEPGEAYEFFFAHNERQMYGKLILCSDGRMIIIYSAHPPEKAEL